MLIVDELDDGYHFLVILDARECGRSHGKRGMTGTSVEVMRYFEQRYPIAGRMTSTISRSDQKRGDAITTGKTVTRPLVDPDTTTKIGNHQIHIDYSS